MSDPKRPAMADYNNRHSCFVTESSKQCICNESQNISSKQCFMSNIDTEVEIKIDNDVKTVKQHLNEHNYFFIEKNIMEYKRNINRNFKDHNYCLLADDKSKNDQHFIDHDYVIPVFKENHSPEQQSESKQVALNQSLHLQERATTYKRLPGVRLNSNIYLDNLYHRYYKHSTHNKTIYLVCANQKNRAIFCPVTASISSDFNDNSIKTSGEHNHLPQPIDIPMIFLRSALGLQAIRSESQSKSIKQLYSQEKYINPEGAKRYSLVQSQLRIRRIRRRLRRNNRLFNQM